MFAHTPDRYVQDYPSASASVAAREHTGKGVDDNEGHSQRAGQAILEEISGPHTPSAELLVDAVRAYLEGEVDYEQWSAAAAGCAVRREV